MRILVCVKRVPMTGGKIVLTEDAQEIETKHLGFTISPHEECGVEEAVRLVEAHGGESVVLTLGPPEAEEQLRDAMALGADRAIHLVSDGEEWDPQATAARDRRGDPRGRGGQRAVRPGLLRERVGGRRRLPGRDPRRVRARPSRRDRAQGRRGRGRTVRCEQEVAGGRDVYVLPLPAVVTVLEGLNLPRYPSVPAKLRAQRKPLDATSPARPESKLEKLVSSCRRARASRPRSSAAGPRPRPRSSRSCGGSESRDVSSSTSRSRASSRSRRSRSRAPRRAGAGVRASARTRRDLGVETVHVAEGERFASYAPAAIARALVELVDRLAPSAVVAAATTRQRGARARRRDHRPAVRGELRLGDARRPVR